jgi:hypothetical protein
VTKSQPESETESACKYCTNWRSRYRKDVGDLIIIRRALKIPRPKENGQHTHILIRTSDFGNIVPAVSRALWLYPLLAFLVIFITPQKELAAIFLTAIGIVLQTFAIVFSLAGNPRPSYGKALSLLYGAGASSECVSLQKQYLHDAALELYSVNSCKRADFLKLLEWINCRDRTTQEFTEFGEKLIQLLCEHHSRYLFRRIKKALLLSR